MYRMYSYILRTTGLVQICLTFIGSVYPPVD